MKKTIRACPICLANEAEVLHHQQFAIPVGMPLPSNYDIVSCNICHFVFGDTPYNQEQYELYYAKHAKYESAMPTCEDQKRLQTTAEFLQSYLPIESNILDIGCANGVLLNHLHEMGYQHLIGLDPSLHCTQALNKKGIRGVQGALTHLQSSLNEIGNQDAVILSHVIEHLVSPSDMLRSIKKILKDKGLLYIEVPDAAEYCAHFYKPFHFFDVEHINHFDADSLQNLAQQNDFAVIAMGKKVIPVSATVRVPAIYALLQSRSLNGSLIQCHHLKKAMQRYIEMSQEANENTVLEKLAHSQEPVILWGAGSYAQNLLKNSLLSQCNVVAIVDRDPNKQGKSILGNVIHDPSHLLTRTMNNEIILIASIPFAGVIQEEIATMKLQNRIEIA